jgi:hypothetical protein
MKTLWGKMVCKVMGHKRGRRITHGQKDGEAATFQCGRCKATWTRPVKAKAA